MITVKILLVPVNKFMLSTIFLTILGTYQMLKTIDNKVILFIKPKDMALQILPSNMIIHKIQLDQESKSMLNTIFPTTPATYQT